MPSKEYQREWYRRNREKALGYARRWRDENRERLREIGRQSYQRNKDKHKIRHRKYVEDNKELVAQKRRHRTLKSHGMTPQQYKSIFDAQGGVCAICKNPPIQYQLAVDHHHETNRNRGLLCENCNRGLGLFSDSAKYLRAAADYLEAYCGR